MAAAGGAGAVAVTGALSSLSAPAVCSRFPQASFRASSSLACSSMPCLSLPISRASERGTLNWSCASCGFTSSGSNSNYRSRTMSAAQSSITEGAVQTDGLLPETGSPLVMTYLEGNSWLWEIMGLKILVDPVLVGNLDFGIPLLYDGAKIIYKDFKLEDLPKLDYLLITQGYDDHCHEKTLGPLSRLMPNLPVISSPNAQKIINKYFKTVTYLEPTTKERITLKAKNGTDVVVRASPGPILGPPWQRPESGYFIEVKEPKFSLYHEPHCVFENAKLEQEQEVDVIVTPVIKQVLPGYTLVSGQEDAVKVAEWLKPKFVVTMKNGELNTTGILSKIVRTEGTTDSFEEMLRRKLPNVKVLQPTAGVPLMVPVA